MVPIIRCSFVIVTYLMQNAVRGRATRHAWSLSKVPDVTVEVVILAMIAAFLGLRLYSVLGRRAEHEEEIIQGRFETKRDLADDAGPRPLAPRLPERAAAPNAPVRPRELPGVLAVAERGLRDIAAADRRFDPLMFLQGARAAYRMVLEAFWQGDREQLAQLCDRDVYEGFDAAIEARTAAGEVLDNRLVRIEDATIVDASLDGSIARITVRFTADVAAVTRNADGVVVAGSLNDAVEAKDLWTFSRDLTAAGPDWLLDETDEA
jgi:predicted lipid-binding transport protein (Tim44 family)